VATLLKYAGSAFGNIGTTRVERSMISEKNNMGRFGNDPSHNVSIKPAWADVLNRALSAHLIASERPANGARERPGHE